MLAWVHVVAVVAVALVVTGFAWIAVLSSLNATAQGVLPDWVRSRGMALYIIVFQGGQAVGALIWGVVVKQADTQLRSRWWRSGCSRAPWRAAGGCAHPAGSTCGRRSTCPEPDMVIEPDPLHGPVLVTVEYRVPPERAEAFRDAMQPVGRARRRSGGERWGSSRTAPTRSDSSRRTSWPTWEEHLRQHQERTRTPTGCSRSARASSWREGTQPRVEHLLWAYRT